MRRVLLFAEDEGHETIMVPLVEKVASEEDLEVHVEVRSAVGGAGRMTRELKRFLRDLDRGTQPVWDLLVVARDANCQGFRARQKELEALLEPRDAVLAVPNPHVERWLLLDGHAFGAVLGRGCRAPDSKCDKGRYKALLREAVVASGRQPVTGGLEFAGDIVRAMDLPRSQRQDPSLAHFVRDLRAAFHRWRVEGP